MTKGSFVMFDRVSSERAEAAPEARAPSRGGRVQRRRAGSALTVGPADDPAERDAHGVAAAVLARLNDSERRGGVLAHADTRIRRWVDERVSIGSRPPLAAASPPPFEGEVAVLNGRVSPFGGTVRRKMEAAFGAGAVTGSGCRHDDGAGRITARSWPDERRAQRMIRRMLATEDVGTKKAKTPWNTVVDRDAKSKLMRGRWRPAETSVIDRVVVRMMIREVLEAKPYPEVEPDSVSPSSSLKIPIETDAGSALRHWWMLFRIPKPEFGDRPQSEWEKLDTAEMKEVEELDYQGSVNELSGRAPALDPAKPVWMQVDVTTDSDGGYRIFWKPAPTSGVAARADYAGSCTLTVGLVRAAMGDLAKEYTKYVNPPRKSGDEPVLDLYSCHTFVRKMNARLGLGIDIPAIATYT